MLNIYYGAEKTDKEKFIFDNIKGRTLLLVPDQFSLQAERDAFFYLGKKSLMDLRVVDFSTLGRKVVKEAGGARPALIDKYGSQMLLTKAIGRVDSQLGVYRGFSWKSSFIDRIYGVISDMKRYGAGPDELEEVMEGLDENSYLRYKLKDIIKIYSSYQELIEGKYLDNEDYILFYGDKLLSSPMVAESEIWLYGFDTFTPKNILIIERLIKAARAVNVVMTYEKDNEIFELTKRVMENLAAAAEGINEEVSIRQIDGEDRQTVWGRLHRPSGSEDEHGSRPEAMALQQPENEASAGLHSSEDGDALLTLVSASGIYAEAERAAAYILSLVRDKGYRYGDIVVVCNDMDGRGGIFARTFSRWGIPLFMDRKRTVMHHPAVGFLLAIMEIVSGGYRPASVMKLIKSGMMGFSGDECDLLENYASSFRIRGSMWSREFAKTGGRYSDDELKLLNELRAAVVETIERAGDSIGRYNTAAEKVRGLYDFLDRDLDMRGRIQRLMDRQEEEGFSEAAAETAQSWNIICSILDQIVEIIGDEKVSNEELMKLMTIGMERVEIGLVPVSSDRVIMGTLQRTRLSRVKALLIVGANAGVLPMESSEEGLISDREKAVLEELDIHLSKRDHIVRAEELLAIYRTLHLPEERLYISCAGAGTDGEAQRPSEVFAKLSRLAAERPECSALLGDLEESGNVLDMLTCSEGAMTHLTDAVRRYADGEDIDDSWLHVLSWYEENRPEELRKAKEGMLFDNTAEAIGEQFSDALYRGDMRSLEVSASRLEKYSSCPFAHFIMYGLRAEDPVVYEMGAREIGDVYHYCLMKLSRRLTPSAESGIAVDDSQSPWMTVTREQCRQHIEDIISNEMEGFREGLLEQGKSEKYRTARITDTCCDVAWAMIKQVRKGRIREMYFEQSFGAGRALPPVEVEAAGHRVLIRGTIDRLDVLHENAVRVVDYKTGSDTIDVDHIREGYKLQLMIYLKAAMNGANAAARAGAAMDAAAAAPFTSDGQQPPTAEAAETFASDGQQAPTAEAAEAFTSDGQQAPTADAAAAAPFADGYVEPAGVFYFKISDLETDADKVSPQSLENTEKRLDEGYRLVGIVLDDERLIEAMDSQMSDGDAAASDVIPIKPGGRGKAYKPAAGGHLLDREEFGELMEQVDLQVKRICSEICSGEISIKPKKERKQILGEHKTACRYCSYRSICMFDEAFEGCSYQWI